MDFREISIVWIWVGFKRSKDLQAQNANIKIVDDHERIRSSMANLCLWIFGLF